MIKMAIGGAILGAVAAVLIGESPIMGIIVGFAAGIALRKWIFRNLWK